METKEIRATIDRLYKAVEKSGWSSHLWHDRDLKEFYHVREICDPVLPVGFRLICQHDYGKDGNGMTKRCLFTVENESTGERIIDAYVTAFAAGRVGDVWSAYDCTATFFKHEYFLP